MNKMEQILQGFNYALKTLNQISVSGVDNCEKIYTVYNNLNVFLSMLINNEIQVTETKSEKESNDTI